MLHLYALLYTGMVLGRLHVVSTPFLMWAFFPLAPPAVIAGASFVAEHHREATRRCDVDAGGGKLSHCGRGCLCVG